MSLSIGSYANQLVIAYFGSYKKIHRLTFRIIIMKTYAISNRIQIISMLISLIGFAAFATSYKSNPDLLTLNEFREIRGEVVDSKTKEPLVNATLNLVESNIVTVTNTDGHFTLKIPKSVISDKITVSFLGYKLKTFDIKELNDAFNTIILEESTIDLQEINLTTITNAKTLIEEVFKNKADNYFNDPVVMTGFYRETIKRRNRNVSLSEAVVNIYKSPYTSGKRDDIKLYKARKSTDYKRLDTIALKLQGGPCNSLFLDIVKYPEYIFANEKIDDYVFTIGRTTEINNALIYVIKFRQKDDVNTPLYKGELFIEPHKKVLVSAVFSLNITDEKEAGYLFVKKKPKNAEVYPTEIIYRVDYKSKNNKWYFSYGNAQLQFKINWHKKLFNTVYTLSSEMDVTDWNKNMMEERINRKDFIKPTIILSDAIRGFSGPDFWGEHNIIEPDKNIESAIKKIQRQIRKSNSNRPLNYSIP